MRADRAAPLLAAAAALVLSGCALGLFGGGSSFERHFEAGRYREAMAVFESDSAVRRREEPLFRAGMLHAAPDGPFYEPDRARRLLERLFELYPDTRYRLQAGGLLALLRRMREAERRATDLEDRIARLESDLLEAEGKAARLRTELEESNDRASRLEKKLEKAVARAARLEKQLKQLKKVHLGQPPDTGELDGPGQGTRPPR